MYQNAIVLSFNPIPVGANRGHKNFSLLKFFVNDSKYLPKI